MQAIRNKAKEENVKKFKQLLRHKQEMLERAKQYDGIDIYAKFAAPNKYTIQSANTAIEGQGFYSSIIVENRNPLLEEIKADFEKSANDLKEK